MTNRTCALCGWGWCSCVDADAVKIALELEWKDEADRLRKLFDDAGQQGEHNVLAMILIDHSQRLRAVRKLLEENGCDCPCDHHPDERGKVCLACRIGEAVGA